MLYICNCTDFTILSFQNTKNILSKQIIVLQNEQVKYSRKIRRRRKSRRRRRRLKYSKKEGEEGSLGEKKRRLKYCRKRRILKQMKGKTVVMKIEYYYLTYYLSKRIVINRFSKSILNR